jgi:hypothetical protein
MMGLWGLWQMFDTYQNWRKISFFLGTLDSLRYKYFGEGGVIRVCKGSLVVMKGNKRDRLYFLRGCVVTGSATVSSSDDPDSNTTRLWHMRLGHMSERGVTILSKWGLLCDQKTWSLDFCEQCVFEKQCRVKFSTGIQTSDTMNYMYSNLWGIGDSSLAKEAPRIGDSSSTHKGFKFTILENILTLLIRDVNKPVCPTTCSILARLNLTRTRTRARYCTNPLVTVETSSINKWYITDSFDKTR